MTDPRATYQCFGTELLEDLQLAPDQLLPALGRDAAAQRVDDTRALPSGSLVAGVCSGRRR
jgi:hypothetical protein